jgi:tryptophan 2,3-dioxygenase
MAMKYGRGILPDHTFKIMTDRLTYWHYIKLDAIHDLQSNAQTDCFDEPMFIAVHQHFELWFAQVIRNLDETIRRLMGTPPEVASAAALMNRVNREFHLATQGFDVMKTLSREQFMAFRGALGVTSGLQSAHLTVIELLVGRRADEMYHAEIAGPGMVDFQEKYGGENGLLATVARDRATKGTLRVAYDRVAADSNLAGPDFEMLKRQIANFDDQLFSWRKHHYEMAAKVLEKDFTDSSGTVGNEHSCRDNLKIGITHTHRYFEELVNG